MVVTTPIGAENLLMSELYEFVVGNGTDQETITIHADAIASLSARLFNHVTLHSQREQGRPPTYSLPQVSPPTFKRISSVGYVGDYEPAKPDKIVQLTPTTPSAGDMAYEPAGKSAETLVADPAPVHEKESSSTYQAQGIEANMQKDVKDHPSHPHPASAFSTPTSMHRKITSTSDTATFQYAPFTSPAAGFRSFASVSTGPAVFTRPSFGSSSFGSSFGPPLGLRQYGTLTSSSAPLPMPDLGHLPQSKKRKVPASASLGAEFEQMTFPTAFHGNTFEVRQNNSEEEDYTPVFLSHVDVYLFAKEWDASSVCSLALQKLHTTLKSFKLHKARVPDVVTLARYIYGVGDDNKPRTAAEDELRKMVMLYICRDIKAFHECNEFQDLMAEGGDLVKGILGIVMKQFL